MADFADMSQEVAEVYESAAITQRVNYKLTPKGSCHWCYEPLGDKRLFCDGDCADDHDKYRKKTR